jgi:uncharacterized membrane protein/predicted DsbA family dithiol-disulfide isomerase
VEILRYPNLTRPFALLGLTISAVLLGYYLQPGAGQCAFNASCDAVLHSSFGRMLGVPLPVIGVLVLAGTFWLSLYPDGSKARLLLALAVAMGLAGSVLLFLQVFVIRKLCPFCLLVDVSAIVIAFAETVQRRSKLIAPTDGKMRVIWLSAGALTLALSLVASAGISSVRGRQNPTGIPPEVKGHWIADKINVVEVADFQCPHCRRMHAVLMQFLSEQRDRVHYVRLTAPMASNRYARHASRAYLCAERQGKGDDMAEALFAAPRLVPATCEELAVTLGLSMEPFRACISDPAIERQLDEEVAWVDIASPHGLPVLWIQDEVVFGERPLEVLRETLRRIEQRSREMAKQAEPKTSGTASP